MAFDAITQRSKVSIHPEFSPLGLCQLRSLTSLISSRLILAGLTATTRRQPSSDWKLHSHCSGPWPLEHSDRRLHLRRTNMLIVTLKQSPRIHKANISLAPRPWPQSSRGVDTRLLCLLWQRTEALSRGIKSRGGSSTGQKLRVGGQGPRILYEAQAQVTSWSRSTNLPRSTHHPQ